MQQPSQDTTVISQDAPAKSAEPLVDNLIGSVVDGKYQILTLLGTGGMSSVYKSKQLLLNKVYALKVLHSRLVTDSNALVRFSQEAKSASTLSHPHIIQVYDMGVVDGRPYQAIEYLEGRSLADEIRACGGLPVARALHVLIQACAALDHAHQNNVIHRDLKPSNIMLVNKEDDPDFVCLVDFGIAKVLPHEGEHVQQLTQTGEILGSPLYMSPEQCLGRKLDARSDIYSMGCLIYETLAGSPPLVGETIFETIQKHQDQMPPSLKGAVKEPRYADQLDQIVMKAMAKDPAQRYPSMFELGKDLLAIEAGDTSSITQKLRRQWQLAQIKLDSQRRRYPIKVLAGMGVSLLLMMSLVIYLAQTLATTKVPDFVSAEWPRFMPSHGQSEQHNTFLTDLVGQSDDLVVGIARRQVDRIYDDPSKSITRAKQVAESYLENGDYGQAAKFYDRVRAEWRDHHLTPRGDNITETEVLFANMADAYYYSNQFDLAAKFYHLAQSQFDDQAEHAYKRLAMKAGDAELMMKHYYEAVHDFLCAANGAEVGSMFTAEKLSRPAGSAPQLDAALYMSKVADATREIGDYTTAQRAYQGAIAEWLRLKSSVDHPEPYISSCYYWLGFVQEKLHDYPAAKASLTEALRALNPKDTRNAHNIAAIWEKIAAVDDKSGDWLGALNARFQAKLIARQS